VRVVTCPSCARENPDDAWFCNGCGGPLAGSAPAGEERKTVSVVFVDLVGFTAQSERLDPEDVRAILSPYHARVRGELERFGGTVEKFIGDAVMAVFGAPRAHEDDPERAVRAALAIREWATDEPERQVRVAVTTGEALVYLDARPEEGEGMVAGDVVNTAARLQAAAQPNGILVDETTFRATRNAIAFRNAEPVSAKGKAEAVAVWEAVQPFASQGVDLARGAATPIVGRDRELELLGSILARVQEERSTQLVTLVGVPGIGKSRLVGELWRAIDRDPASLVTWRQGRCLPYGEHVTYWALGEIVKAEAGILETDQPREAEEKLARAVAAVVGDDAAWLLSELRLLVGLTSDGPIGGGDAAKSAWRRFLEALAERRPTVLVFEDLHWADDGLLDFVDDLVDWLRGVPLLLVGTARPELLERRPAWGGGKANSTTISLQPLGEQETAQLVSSLLQRPLQLADEQRALLERAGGNPLFAEQYVRMLTERGTTGDLPESVQGVIAARLDSLQREEKELLQDAAVHGKVFWLGAVSAAADVPGDEAARILRALERKDFVRRERASSVADDTQYTFQHVLLRDVAYGQVPRRERAEKHARAARWIDGLGRPDDHAELLAHHYTQALELARATGATDDHDLVERAVAALHAAGARALALSAFGSAAEFAREGLALLDAGDPRASRFLLLRAQALLAVGDDALDPALAALEAFQEIGDTEGAGEAATIAARVSWFMGNRADTDRYTDIALAAVKDKPRSRVRAIALAHRSGFLMLGGDFDESIRVGSEALQLAEELAIHDQRARLHIVLGTARCSLGDVSGLDQIRGGIAIAEEIGSLDMAVTGWANLSSELHFLGRLPEARAAWQREFDLSKRYGLDRWFRSARTEGAAWAYREGRWGDALELANEAIADIDAGRRDYADAIVLSLRAWIGLARGETAAAERDSARAADLARASDAQAQAAAYTTRTAVALALGNRAEAHRTAADLLKIGSIVVPALCAGYPTLADTAWAFRDLGRPTEFVEGIVDPSPIHSHWNDAARAIAGDDAARAAAIIASVGDRAAEAYARMRAAEACELVGNHDEAIGHRAVAEDFYGPVGAVGFLRRGRPAQSLAASEGGSASGSNPANP
jgi:class 3 adenylate cyclase/tetratricopeptide (TPR) repeat protein